MRYKGFNIFFYNPFLRADLNLATSLLDTDNALEEKDKLVSQCSAHQSDVITRKYNTYLS